MNDIDIAEWERMEGYGDYGFAAWMRQHGPALRAEVPRLRKENEGLRKAEALLRAGMESQAELMDELKQKNRTKTDLLNGMQRALGITLTDGTDDDPVAWCERLMAENRQLREQIKKLRR